MARDGQQTFNVLKRADLPTLVPAVPWDAYLGALGAPAGAEVAMENPRFLARVGELFQQTSAADWQRYLRLRLLDDHVRWLPTPFLEALYAFYQATPPPREYQCYSAMVSMLPDRLGPLFIKRNFSEAQRAAAPDQDEGGKAEEQRHQPAGALAAHRPRSCRAVGAEATPDAIDRRLQPRTTSGGDVATGSGAVTNPHRTAMFDPIADHRPDDDGRDR
mgnify:CR=1 FL=1